MYIVPFVSLYFLKPAIFANPRANPSSKFMTTHPILSYPINPGLKEFQIFEYNGRTYYVIN